MGLIVREGTAPIADGETASGTEMELEIDKLFDLVNGEIDNANVASDAEIAGSKLAANTLPGTKIQDGTIAAAQIANDTITTAKMAAAAVVRGYVSTSSASSTAGTATAYANVPGLSTASAVSLTVGDLIFLDFQGKLQGSAGATAIFTYGVDGTDQADLVTWDVSTDDRQVSVPWVFTATATAHTIIPRVKRSTLDGVTVTWSAEPKVFRVLSIPQKA